jgi:dipeptidyl aminopeptidase/acylaminoacyl peptidase
MSAAKTKPYGSWNSPLTPDMMAEKSISLSDLKLDNKGNIYILESRPADKGRTVLTQLINGKLTDITPDSYNIRTRVHEYGGNSFTLNSNECFFANFKDQKLYKQVFGNHPQPLTPEKPFRFADIIFDSNRNALFAVMEDHTCAPNEPANSLVKIDAETGKIETIASGCDFYAAPALSHSGNKLAYFSWNHPNMPWDANELWVIDLNKHGLPTNSHLITGGANESVFQPTWGKNDELFFVTDKTGWWNLYSHSEGKTEILYEMNAEFARSQWRLGDSTFAVIDSENLLCTWAEKGRWSIGKLNLNSRKLSKFETSYTSFNSINIYNNHAYFIGASDIELPSIIQLNLDTGATQKLYTPIDLPISVDYISRPIALEFPTDNGKMAHAFYYPPHNPNFEGLENELPPLIVMSHGGPTSATKDLFSLGVQFWTTRGFAVVDVNYGGSTGYGRAYRERLKSNWGIVDMQDCQNAALYLANQKKADKNRMAIRGGSAGGYTTLASLTFLDTFKAGASYFGISDLEALAQDTHKFESRYNDSLLGPYPEDKEKYFNRSPINFIDKLSCPVIFFQGLQDKVVPPNQAEEMFKKLVEKKIPTAYIKYPQEAHGFRKAENIKHSIQTELYFYGKVFGFELSEDIPEIEIENL